jgi:Fur family zinc uptake transcriptional regulator
MRVATADSDCNQVPAGVAEQFESRALERLRVLGMRLTGPRRTVLRVLAETRRPLGAYQIREAVQAAGGRVDVVSVYRILAGLVEAGLAHRIGMVDGYLACSASHAGDHQTEHLICRSCGCVEEIPIPQSALSEIGVAGSRQGFLGQATRVEVMGICEHCR